METKIPGKQRRALAADKKDTSVKTKSARRVVKLAGSAAKQAISKLNALDSIS